MLREGRAWAADRIASWTAGDSRRERVFIRAGRIANRWSHPVGTIYAHAIQRLALRLRARGNVYRDIQCGPFVLAFDVTDQTGLHEYFYGTAHRYEPALVDYLIAHLRPGDVCIDVGANIGFLSVVAAKLVAPGGRVVAFEPHPDARAALGRLLERNGVTAIVDVERSAPTNVVGSGPLYLTDDNILSTLDPGQSPLRADFVFDRSVDVELTTLDAWLAGRPEIAPRISLIKIDVEGVEDRVLAGMESLLGRAPRARVICETSAGGDFDRRITELGFTSRLLDEREGSFGNYLYERASTSLADGMM
jgi:FkbM family methyltransferase